MTGSPSDGMGLIECVTLVSLTPSKEGIIREAYLSRVSPSKISRFQDFKISRNFKEFQDFKISRNFKEFQGISRNFKESLWGVSP